MVMYVSRLEILPEAFHWIKLWRVWWEINDLNIVRYDQIIGFMPSCLIHNDNDLSRIVCDYLTKRTNCWVYPLTVFTSAFLGALVLKKKLLPVQESDLQILFVGYTGSLFAMFAIVLTLLAFGSSNLPHKTSYTFQLLLRKAWFFPLVFSLGFTILAALLSNLVSGFCIEVYNCNVKTIILMIIFLIILGCLYAFSMMVRFLFIDKLLAYLKRDLIYTMMEKYKASLMEYVSGDIYSTKLVENGIVEHSLYFGDTVSIDIECDLRAGGRPKIADVNLKRLLRHKQDLLMYKMEFINVNLDKEINDLRIFKSKLSGSSGNDWKRVKKAFCISYQVVHEERQDIIQAVTELLQYSIKNDDRIMLDRVTRLFDMTYNEFLINLRDNYTFLSDTLINYIFAPLFIYTTNAIDELKSGLVYLLVDYQSSLVRTSCIHRDLTTFGYMLEQMRKIYCHSAIKMNENLNTKKMHNMVSYKITNRYVSIFQVVSTISKQSLSEDKHVGAFDEYFVRLITSFLSFVYNMTSFDDHDNLIHAWVEYSRLKYVASRTFNTLLDFDDSAFPNLPSANRSIYSIYIHSVLIIRFWCYFLLINGKLDPNSSQKLRSSLSTNYFGVRYDINDVLSLYDRAINDDLQGVQHWDYLDREIHQVYSPIPAHKWIVVGFIVDQLVNRKFALTLIDMNIMNSYKFIDECIAQLKLVKDFPENYNKLLTVDEGTRSTIDNYIKVLQELQHKINNQALLSIIAEPISEVERERFLAKTHSTYKERSLVNTLFNDYGHIEYNDTKVIALVYNPFQWLGRESFIEENTFDNPYAAESAEYLTQLEENEFFGSILSLPRKIHIFNRVADAIESGIKDLEDGAQELVIIAGLHTLSDGSLNESGLFTLYTGNRSEDPIVTGGRSLRCHSYKDYPLYHTYCPLLVNQVIVCDFKKAFRLVLQAENNDVPSKLSANIVEIDSVEALRLYESTPDQWKDRYDKVLPKDEAMLYLKASLFFEFKLFERVEIVENSKIHVSKIQNDIS